MQARFVDSAVARSFATFVDLYGMRFSVRRSAALDVAAASASSLKFAAPGGSAR
jgi:hypothetical protein